MCQKKPGTRCSKHARRALKSSFDHLLKAKNSKKFSKDPFTQKQLVKEATAAHKFSVDMYYASPIMFNLISETADFYPMANYLRKNLKKALKNSKDSSPETPLGIGHKVSFNSHGISKDLNSTQSIVRERTDSYTVWDQADPFRLSVINTAGKVIDSIPLTNKNVAYGFEPKTTPDIHWAIWYSKKLT
jgi:hypothetical protein